MNCKLVWKSKTPLKMSQNPPEVVVRCLASLRAKMKEFHHVSVFVSMEETRSRWNTSGETGISGTISISKHEPRLFLGFLYLYIFRWCDCAGGINWYPAVHLHLRLVTSCNDTGFKLNLWPHLPLPLHQTISSLSENIPTISTVSSSLHMALFARGSGAAGSDLTLI